jgi:hypothetical protein
MTEAQLDKDMDTIGRAGGAAWKRIKTNAKRLWTDWMVVGEALSEGRRFCMHRTGTNKPEGKAYNQLFHQYLVEYKLDDIDKSARAKLLKVMDHRGEIEDYRATLTQGERIEINHPVVMLRRWQSATAEKKPKGEGEGRQSMQAYIEELEASREPVTFAGAREQYLAQLGKLDGDGKAAELKALIEAAGLEVADLLDAASQD